MRNLIYSLLVFSVFLAGCQKEEISPQSEGFDPNITKTILAGTSLFPDEMKGVWRNEEHGWMFKIDENGYLTKVRHIIGQADLAAGQTTTIPLVNNGKATLIPGPWYIQYNGETKNIVIEITLEHFEYNLGSGNMVSGSSRDLFMGMPPEHGQTTWKAEWISFPEFVASTGDQTYQDYKLPFYEGTEEQGEIVFEKLDLEELKKFY